MILSPGEYTYKVLIHEWQYAEIYRRMLMEDLLWAAWPDMDPAEWNEDTFCQWLSTPSILVIGGYAANELAGVMTLWPVTRQTLCAEIGVTAFRDYFSIARELCYGALLHGFELTGASSYLGRIVSGHRHILRMFASLGFYELGKVPGLMWHARKKQFVDGVLVCGTPESIKAVSGG